tara:strand:+ start:27 stop:656 length:630 start_codon:yes stop_codon:yes gene_type:complete
MEKYQDIRTELREKNLLDEEYKDVVDLIKNENPSAILSSLDNETIIEFLKISIFSKNIFFYTCTLKNRIIGYAILTSKPNNFISEFHKIKFLIIKNLIKKLKIKIIINLVFSFSKLDLILISRNNRKIIKKSLNLNMLAVKKEFQSKGIGTLFLRNIIDFLNKSNEFSILSVESFDPKAINFYKKNLNFFLIGKKLRFFKNLSILFKNL